MASDAENPADAALRKDVEERMSEFASFGTEYKDIVGYENAVAVAVEMVLEERNKNFNWYCRCGHWNGPNLSVCATCGRSPGTGANR